MAGIAGIDQLGKEYTVKKMLSKISHRGNAGWHVQEVENATFGIVYSEPQEDSLFRMKRKNEALDGNSPGHQALVKAKEDGLVLKRDPLGVAPLYYGEDEGGSLYFASEVKALVDFCSDIHILPPGYRFDGEQLTSYFELKEKRPLDDEPDI
ncbi:MAG: asparagine synthase, partial [Candidatus Aminicenantaceae bacterium]